MLIGVIFLKRIFKVAFITFLSVVVFFGAAYAYLDYTINKNVTNADQKEDNVPYNIVPDSCGIAFVFPNNDAWLTYLDFDNLDINVLQIENFNKNQPEYYGYTVDYNVNITYDVVAEVIDRIGGIEIEQNGERLRYTGVQVLDLIAYGYDGSIKEQIFSQIFNSISKNNFSKEDLLYIIENSKSDLSFVDCIPWIDYLKSMCNRINYVN